MTEDAEMQKSGVAPAGQYFCGALVQQTRIFRYGSRGLMRTDL
jgi:hypothetical protein